MKDYETIVKIILVTDDADKGGPFLGRDIAGVDWIGKLMNIDTCLNLLKFRECVYEMMEVERLKGTGVLVASHTYRSTRINK